MALIERIADRFDLADGIIKSGACVHAPPGISFFCAPLLPSIPGRRGAGAGAMAQLLLLFKTLKESYDLFDEVDPGNQEARPDLAPPPPPPRARAQPAVIDAEHARAAPRLNGSLYTHPVLGAHTGDPQCGIPV